MFDPRTLDRAMLVHASIGSNVGSFFDAVGSFLDSLSKIGWGSLLIGALAFVLYLTLRSRAFFHTLRAAYPSETIAFRRIWGAYIAAYGFNNVIPARGGDVIKLFLVKRSIPHATYPAVGAAICVEAIFDGFMAIFVLTFAFTPGRVPQAAGLRQARRVRPLVPRRAPALHAVRAHGAGDRRARRVRGAVTARAGVLGRACARA